MTANNNMDELKEVRKQWFHVMEQKLQETYTKEEDRMFYYHSSENFYPCILASRW